MHKLLFLAILAGSVASAAEPTVNIVGTDPQTGLKFSVGSLNVRLPLVLEAKDGTVKDLKVQVDDFVGPDSRIVPVRIALDGQAEPKPRKISPADRIKLEITATFLAAGDYRSYIALFYSGKWHSTQLTVTRQKNANQVQIDAVPAMQVIGLCGADADKRFTVRETAGQEIVLNSPVFINFALNQGDKKQLQGSFTNVEVLAQDPANGSWNKIPETISLKPLTSQEFRAHIHGIKNAGEYSGLVRVSSADGNLAEKEVTFFVKDAGWFAFLLIFLGCGVSYCIRLWTKEERPRLVALRRTGDLFAALKKVEASARQWQDIEKKVIDGIRDRINQIERELNRGTIPDAAALDEISRKIGKAPEWLSVGDRIAAVKPADIVATPLQDWRQLAEDYFLLPGALDKDFTTALEKVKDGITEAVKKYLLTQIGSMEKTITDYKTAHPAAAAEIDHDLLPLIARAKSEAEGAKFTEASGELNKLRAKFAQLLAGDLLALVSVNAPLGVDPDTWQELRMRLNRQIDAIKGEEDPDKAIDLYNHANGEYLETVLEGVQTEIAAKKAEIAVSGFLSPEKRKELLAELQDSGKSLEASREALEAGDTNKALKSYGEALKTLKDVIAEITSTGGRKLAVATPSASAAEWLAALPAGAVVSQTKALPSVKLDTRTDEQLSREIWLFDLLLSVVIMLVATILGMKLLWADDPVWGGGKAYMIAFLWGLGLQQVTGSAADGVSALTKKLLE